MRTSRLTIRHLYAAAGALVLAFVCACGHQATAPAASPANPGSFLLTDITAKAGIRWTRSTGAFGKKWFPETTGGGCAFLDYDNDGYPDILLVNGDWYAGHELPGPRPTLALYHNNHDGTFTDVTAQTGLKVSIQGMACAVGDYDNDGYDDFVVTGIGGNHLFHNEPARSGGGRVFREVTLGSGVRGEGWSTSAAWIDYDNDGKLDLFVCHYVPWSPATDLYCGSEYKTYCVPTYYHGESCRLYHNDGGGRFHDATKQAGLFNDNSKGLGVCTVDFDHDGLMDIVVSNDLEVTFAFHNNGDGTFKDVSMVSGLALGEDAVPRSGMGIDAADIRNDGKLAFLIGNFSFQGGALYAEQTPGLYTDTARETGIMQASFPYVTWGTLFCDLDNDGWVDALITNGHVDDLIERSSPVQHYLQPTLALRNQRNGTFANVTGQSGPGLATPLVGRSIASGDIDNDGKLDLLLVPNVGAPRLLHNETPRSGHWLTLALIGTGRCNRDGYGALVRVTAGGITHTDTARSSSGYASSSDRRVHFGLGAATRADSIEIRWPDGRKDVWRDVAADRILTVVEGQPPVARR